MPMRRLLLAEFMKVRFTTIMMLILIDAVVNAVLGAASLNSLQDFYAPGWDSLYLHSVNFHALFFYPLYAGIFASFLCHCEHSHGGWKQMFCLPIRPSAFYWSKLCMLMLLMGMNQLVFIGGFLLTGWLLSVPGTPNGANLILGSVGGWMAIGPFAALQLWVSIRIKSFATSLILTISLVIPNIVLTGLHASIGALLPFTASYYAMFPRGTSSSPRLDLIPFILILAISFFVYTWLGRRSFLRRDGVLNTD